MNVPTTCPQCHKTYPGGDRAGHCAECHQTFIGLTAFDAHRVGTHGINRHCQIQPYEQQIDGKVRYGHWADPKGHWHHGRQLTQSERDQIFNR